MCAAAAAGAKLAFSDLRRLADWPVHSRSGQQLLRLFSYAAIRKLLEQHLAELKLGAIGAGVALVDDPRLEGECMYEELSVHDISIDENARTIILQQGLIPLVDATLEFVVILLCTNGAFTM